jgi:type II secretory pathway predicted ATPase ExeA
VAIKQIASTTRGIPRSINILCDTALVYGFSTGADKIDVGLIREVIKDRNDFGVLGS